MRNFVYAALAVVLLAGCPSIGHQTGMHTKTVPVETQFQLGQVNMTVSKPVPWYKVKHAYKPKFEIKSANDLLDEVAPLTGGSISNESLRQVVQAELAIQGLSIDESRTNSAESGVSEEGVETSSSTFDTETTRSRKTPSIGNLNAGVPSTTFTYKTPEREGDYDPFTKYSAATAVYQRIKALDTYLDTDYNTDEEAAFLVHAQITPISYSINQPYDVLTTISLYTELSEHSPTGEKIKSNKQRGEENYRIFPLIVIDNPERVASERRSKQAQEFLGKLGASGGSLAGGLSVQRILELLEVTYGDDFNSLQSISQNHEKDLFVRVGAGFDPDSHYEIRNRPVDVSFVVTIPRKDITKQAVELITYMSSQFRHVSTGKALPKFNESDVEELAKLYKRHASCDAEIDLEVARQHIQRYFRGEDLNCWVPDLGIYHRLYGERRKLVHEGHAVSFGPLLSDPPAPQNVVYTDDKKKLQATIVNKRNSDTTLLRGALLVNPISESQETFYSERKVADEVYLARKLIQNDDVLTLEFPSLRALGQDVEQSNLALLLSFNDKGENPSQYPMRYQKPPKQSSTRSASFKLGKLTDRFQGDSKTQLSALLTISPNKVFAKDIEKLKIMMNGVVLTSVTGLSKQNTPVALTDAELDITTSSFSFKPGKEAIYKLELEQKGPQSVPLLVAVQALDSAGKPIAAESQKLLFK